VLIVLPVTYSHVYRLLEAFQTGPPGLNVASHVVAELNNETDYAPIHDQETMEQNARDQLMKHGHVSLKCVQHQWPTPILVEILKVTNGVPLGKSTVR